jgi:hypothetical protein
MGIRRTYGEEAVAGLGFQTGKAQAEKERAQQLEERSYREAVKAQDLAIDLQMQERAKLWELEKLEMRSRMDFEREERQRQKILAERDAKLNALKNAYDNGQIDETDYNNAVLQTQTDIPVYTQSQINRRASVEDIPSPTRQLSNINAAFELQGYTSADLEEIGLDPNDFPMVPSAEELIESGDIPTPTGESVIVQDREGNIVQIPSENLEQAIELGATVLNNPSVRPKKHSPAGKRYLEKEAQKNPYYYLINPSKAPGFKRPTY